MTVLDVNGHELDRLGRRVLQQFTPITFIRAIPGFIERFRKVPSGAFTHNHTQATIKCACGREVVIETGHLRNCDGCERTFLFDGTPDLLVGNSPTTEGGD